MNIRLGFFLSGLVLFSFLGLMWPRVQSNSRGKLAKRMIINLVFGSLGALLTNAILPGGLYFIAEFLSEKNFGLFNQIKLPFYLEVAVTIIFLDLAIYGQHVLSHKWNFLWRFHKVHHGDPFFDSTTALRFHPGEILYSFFFKALLITLFGLDKYAVLAFEIILNFSAMFNHGNFSLPHSLEGQVRKIIVTPSFHRVHHSPIRSSTDSNYGFFFSLWDYFFSTYNRAHEDNQTFGLKSAAYSGSQNIFKLLWAPVVTKEKPSKKS